MRAFIAVELPINVRDAVVSVQRALATTGADVKWVEADNLHVTMRFLGEITEVQRQAIERILKKAAGHTSPIQVGLSHIGAFPSSSSPRVIWVGIGQGSETLTRLAGEVEEGLAGLKMQKEDREFVAHVTLGRVRSPKNRAQLATRLKEVGWNPPAPFRIERVTLFQSTLGGAGPVYTALGRFPLTAA